MPEMSNQQEQQIKENPTQKNFLTLEARKKDITRGLIIFWLVSTVLLFLRIFLEGLGSDPKSAFVFLIYLLSSIFLLPFFNIFPNQSDTIQPGQPTFDSSAFTAIFCYTVLVILAWAVLNLVIKILKTEKQVDETVKRNNLLDPRISEKVVH